MIKLVIFDMDETIVRNEIPFFEMRERIMKEIGSDENPPHLYEFLKSRGNKYVEILKREEIRRAKNSHVDKDLEYVLRELKNMNVRVAILTRNCREATFIALGKFAELFDSIITREDGFPPKPAPDAVVYLMSRFKSRGSETMVVGDYDYDMDAGSKAGCITVRLGDGYGDYKISRLRDIIKILEELR